MSGAAIGASASVEEKASISSSSTLSASANESISAGSKTTTSATALVAASSAAMGILYVHYAHKGCVSMESMTFSAEINAAAQEIQRVCTGAALDEAALAKLLLLKKHERLQRSAADAREPSGACGLHIVEAEILRKATKGLDTTGEWIYPVVMARSNAEIALLKKTFAEKEKVILTAMRGEVADFDTSVHTSAKAVADADALYKAGEGRMGTDETTFINILVLSPAEHGRRINSAYVTKYNTSVTGAIEAGSLATPSVPCCSWCARAGAGGAACGAVRDNAEERRQERVGCAVVH
ncbi:hypothetical protein V7S43_018974 [Phytophthora oleae]|uniref:Uncharacterized protein n=1 Tax=Phytophthora oleae TaxID=2107226 RepID=A0ABD3ESI1_9STRA